MDTSLQSPITESHYTITYINRQCNLTYQKGTIITLLRSIENILEVQSGGGLKVRVWNSFTTIKIDRRNQIWKFYSLTELKLKKIYVYILCKYLKKNYIYSVKTDIVIDIH